MERLKSMKDTLIGCAQTQMGNLGQVDAHELGEVVDMIKDLGEAMYYCSVVKAMEESEEEKKYAQRQMPRQTSNYYYTTPYYMMPPYEDMYRDMDYQSGRMYYSGGGNSSGGSSGSSSSGSSGGNSSGSSGYSSGSGGSRSSGGNNARGGGGRGYHEGYPMMYEYPQEIRDYREGKSPMSRRGYMESKEKNQAKNVQMQELEKYLNELAQDITEMVEEAGPEEKTMLQQKLTTLASKMK